MSDPAELDFPPPSEQDARVHVRTAASHPAGYVVVLLGVAGFVVSCFLPFYGGGFLGPGGTVSLYRLVRFMATGGAELGALLSLFAGAATVAVISLMGIGRARTWTPPALAAGVAAWTLTWLGILLNQSQFGEHEIGYWTAYASLGVTVAGTIVVLLASRRSERVLAVSA